jgi:hypothetical protein
VVKSIPVIIEDKIIIKKGNNTIPVFFRLIFLNLNDQKKKTAETDIMAKTISSTLYKYKDSSCQTPLIRKSVINAKTEKPIQIKLIYFILELFALIIWSFIFEFSIFVMILKI